MSAFGVLRNASVSLEDTEYGATVRKVRLVPDTAVQTYKTLIPSGVLADVDSPAWSLELQGVQDWATGGLAKYLHDNHGTSVTLILAPVNTSGAPEATVEVIAMSPPFGGEQGAFAEFDLTLPCVGQPTFGTVGA